MSYKLNLRISSNDSNFIRCNSLYANVAVSYTHLDVYKRQYWASIMQNTLQVIAEKETEICHGGITEHC